MLSRSAKIGLGVVAGGVVFGLSRKAKASRRRRSTTTTTTTSENYPYPPPKPFKGVPFAQASVVPVFPVAPTSTHQRRLEVPYKDVDGKNHGNAARRFGADRKGVRWHNGIDLYANKGDVVLAPEDGVILNFQNFLPTIDGAGDDAMVVLGDHGITYILGEIDEKAFGLKEGDRVTRGQPVAKVALTDNDSHMLHFETYISGLTSNQKWYKTEPKPPSHLLDPTDYLLRALAAAEAVA